VSFISGIGESSKDEVFLIAVNVLKFPQCFDTVGWVTARASGM